MWWELVRQFVHTVVDQELKYWKQGGAVTFTGCSVKIHAPPKVTPADGNQVSHYSSLWATFQIHTIRDCDSQWDDFAPQNTHGQIARAFVVN